MSDELQFPFEIHCQGNVSPLYCDGLISACGDIPMEDGVSLKFGEERGGFVVSLAALENLVTVARAERVKHADAIAEQSRRIKAAIQRSLKAWGEGGTSGDIR